MKLFLVEANQRFNSVAGYHRNSLEIKERGNPGNTDVLLLLIIEFRLRELN